MHVGLSAFFQNLSDERTDAEVYDFELGLVDLAEPLGFDGVWCAEHHFDNYMMCPNVLQFLTWVAARTSKVKVGSMVVVLPWHDPMWVAEQFSVLDHMSQGRAILGIGRGLAPIEFEGFRVEMGESRERFMESAEAIIRGFESGYMQYDGKYYKQPRSEIRPAPRRSLEGRIYASSNSPSSANMMAELGIGLMIVAQKPWDAVVSDLEGYKNVYNDVNSADPPKPILLTLTAVHESEDGARELRERYLMRYAQSLLDHYDFANADIGKVPGYEYYKDLSGMIKGQGADVFKNAYCDLQISGTPDQVAEKLIESVRLIDGAALLQILSFGGMPQDVAEANMRLFADKVLPILQAEDVGVTL